MKKYYLLFITCLCFVGCTQTNDFSEEAIAMKTDTRLSYSLKHNGFEDIDYLEVNAHSPLKTGIMKGRIYSENGAIYTFRIAAQSGQTASVGFRNSITGYITGGVNKIVNLNLRPGWNHFQLEVVLKSYNTSINARVLIEKVDGISFSEGKGCCDLSIYISNISMTPGPINPEESESFHWVCKKCSAINWGTNKYCICGKEKD